MATDLLQRRRQMMAKRDEWLLIKDLTLGGETIVPTAYDSTTGEYEVQSFPAWANAAVGTEFYSIIVAKDLTDLTKIPIPRQNDYPELQIKKTDDHHFIITSRGRFPSDTSQWELAQRSNLTKIEIITSAEYESLRGKELRLEIFNATSYLSRYTNFTLNGHINYSNGAKISTTEAQSLGFNDPIKYLAYVDVELTLDTDATSVTTTKVRSQWYKGASYTDYKAREGESAGLGGAVTGNLWGKTAARGIYIGNYGISRPDCRIKLYVKR